MKTNLLRLSLLPVAAGGVLLMAGCIMDPPPPPPPPVAVAAPPVTVETDVVIPDDYVWDGDEYVGVVGDNYYYLGPGNVWIICDPVRLGRFHGWEHDHADWRVHAIHNDRFRNDAHGHFHPRAVRGHEERHDH